MRGFTLLYFQYYSWPDRPGEAGVRIKVVFNERFYSIYFSTIHGRIDQVKQVLELRWFLMRGFTLFIFSTIHGRIDQVKQVLELRWFLMRGFTLFIFSTIHGRIDQVKQVLELRWFLMRGFTLLYFQYDTRADRPGEAGAGVGPGIGWTRTLHGSR